jgi:Domain of unknown function (DUF1844)
MEEEKGFSVRDRRIRHDGEAESAAEAAASAPGPEGPAAAAATGGKEAAAGHGFSMGQELPPIDFSAFVFSLARTALIHMGLESHPETGGEAANLEAARETIDVLGMLEDKTRGNLTPEEAELISKMLYTLRMSYVEVARAHGAG